MTSCSLWLMKMIDNPSAVAFRNVELLEAGDLDGVLATLDAQPQVDLVLLDLHMPGNHGLAGLAAVRAQHPGVAVIVVSANDDPRVVPTRRSAGR